MNEIKPMINRQRLLERFLRYVRIDTTANPNSDSYPSSPGQLELGRLLVQELTEMGAENPHQDEHGLVWATIPATVEGPTPTILLNSHVDTSPEAPGCNVDPQVIESYQGGDIALQADGRAIRVAEYPGLEDMVGQCLVTTDGRTLLGGDDKAGVASIMELAQHLLENPHLPHGPVRILFTCDEEIGLGAKHFDTAKAAAEAGYTLDGAGHGEVENENFSADQLEVRATGYNIHPAIAKDKMINAVRAISNLVVRLPRERQSPESTDGKQGFLHPYGITGGVGEASCQILLRDFETDQLDAYSAEVEELMGELEQSFPGLQMTMKRSRQYRNMADALKKAPQVVEFAKKAFGNLDRSCHLGSIRGGTDGAMFSEMGLPTPNLSVGQHNIHSVLEFANVDEMQWAIEHVVELLNVWQLHGRS